MSQQPSTLPNYVRRPWALAVPGLLLVALTASACGGTDGASSAAAASSAPASSSAPAPAPVVPSAAVPPPASATTAASVNFVMPNLVSVDLQTAQNTVQTYGVFFSKSHDLLGSRNQLVDSNWKVCDQNIPAGQQVTGNAEGLIDFGVVKREESCP
jgi:hypothetical protein